MVYRLPIYTIPEGTANRGGGIYSPNLYHPRGNCQSKTSPRELPIGEGQSIPSPREQRIGEASKSTVYHVFWCPSSCIPLVFIFGRSEIIEFHEAYSRLQILSNFLPFLSMLFHISCVLHSMNSLRELPILSLVYHVSCDPHSLSFVREQPILETSQSCS